MLLVKKRGGSIENPEPSVLTGLNNSYNFWRATEFSDFINYEYQVRTSNADLREA